jgi:hypothetical protein
VWLLPNLSFMEIITKLPRYSDGEIDRAFMKEIQTGFKMEREQEKDRIKAVSQEAKQFRGKEHPILGRPVASMPARDFFRLTQKYGHKPLPLSHTRRSFHSLLRTARIFLVSGLHLWHTPHMPTSFGWMGSMIRL